MPSVNDALHIAAIVVDRTVQLQSRLMSHIGTGSSEHCLLGDVMTILVISSAVTGWKTRRDGTLWCSIMAAIALHIAS